MTKFGKFYCVIAVILAVAFIAGCLTELAGIHNEPIMLLSGAVYVIWLPVSLVGAIVFWARKDRKLAFSAASYLIYIVTNLALASDNLDRVKLDPATIFGIAFFGLYAAGNAILLKQRLKPNKKTEL